MGLFKQSTVDQVNAIAAKSKELVPQTKPVSTKSITDQLTAISKQVTEYFSDSPAQLITTHEQLHDYITSCIETGYASIDTETTGLDRIHDTIVGWSLYTPGQVEIYIPCKHRKPIFETPYPNQFTYEECGQELQRLVDAKVRCIFANADFDIAMIYKDFKVDLSLVCFYDVILAWRCLKENERDNSLKGLYAKYPMRGKVDPKKFSDFFPVELFPHCDPKVATLYAANDAVITFRLYEWQLPYITKGSEKCTKHHLEKIADLIWNIEFPMIRVCAMLHRRGVYLDETIIAPLHVRYQQKLDSVRAELAAAVQTLIDEKDTAVNRRRPFRTGTEFNSNSNVHVLYVLKNLLGLDVTSTGKEVLNDVDHPVAKIILDERKMVKLLGTYIDKMPNVAASDSRVHCSYKSIGAATGRMCIAKGTQITLLNGTKNIEDIVAGDLVYCYDAEGCLQLKRVKNVWLTGKDRQCVDIMWQSSGKGDIGHLICTPEHLILKKDGSWARADSLQRYDKLAHLRRVPDASTHRPHLYGWNGIATREQDVVKYSIFGCTDSSSYVVHHIDEDPNNNAISNLQLLPTAQHSRQHSLARADKGLISYDHLHTPESVAKATAAAHASYVDKTVAERDHLLQMIADCNGRLSQVKGDFDSFKHRCEVAGIDVEAECRKYNPTYHKKRISEDEFTEVYVRYNGLAVRITEYFNISYDKFYRYCSDYNISRNHMVQSVTDAGLHDVYDIEVEDCHNFIASEICVHNSSESPNLQNIPSKLHDIRHMFRATPELTESMDITDNTIEISEIDRIEVKNKGLIYVKDIELGDIVTLHNGSASNDFKIQQQEFNESALSYKLTFSEVQE